MDAPLPQHPFVAEDDRSPRIATPRRIACACIPITGIITTPLYPFAITPTLWLGIPAVMVWMASMVVLTVVILNLIDIGVRRQTSLPSQIDEKPVSDQKC